MAKRNRILLGVLVAAVLALLIALCFVGNTFARYTLKQEESVTASIAEWGVTLEDASTSSSSTEFAEIGTLKPVATGYSATETSPRSTANSTETTNFVCVATLTNTGAVDATVTVTATSGTESDGSLTVTPVYQTMTESELSKGAAYGVTTTANTKSSTSGDDTVYTYDPGDGTSKSTDTGYAGVTGIYGSDYAAEVSSHFSAEVYYDWEGTLKLEDVSDDNKFTSTGVTLDNPNKTDAKSTIYIYLDVEWISDLANESYDNGSEVSDDNPMYENGDGFDTWAGMWVDGFSFGLTIEAYQAS